MGSWRLRPRFTSVRSCRPTRIAPLAAAIVGNCLWLLGFSGPFNQVIKQGHARTWVTIAIGLGATLLMLAGDVARRLRTPGFRPWTRVWRSTWRVLPMFAAGLAYSFVIWLALLQIFEGTDLRPNDEVPLATQAVFWASLNLFLGIVVDRYLKGESSLR